MTKPGEMNSPTWATTVMGTDTPLANVPKLQSTIANDTEQLPCAVVADTQVMPPGFGSERVTPPTADGPALATVRLYVTSLPATAVLGPVLVTDTSNAGPVMNVLAVDELLFATGSPVVALTEAVLLTKPPGSAVMCTTSMKPADAPLASVGVVQLTVPPPPTAGAVHDHPAGALTETNVSPADNGSVSVTRWADETPL